MVKKTLDTLVEDIYEKVSTGGKVDPVFVDEFMADCKDSLIKALEEGCKVRPPELRMSMLGTPNLKLWYTFHSNIVKKPIRPNLAISFMYGHIVEAFIMLLVKHAGHRVTRQQETVTLAGVKGHIDGFVDDVLGDVKSASGYGFTKFKDKSIRDKGNDPYGYTDQLSGYAEALGKEAAFLLGVDKSNGELALVEFDEFSLKNSSKRIEEVKAIIASDTPPPVKCYPDIKDGESGNRILDKPCVWCPYHDECYKDANEGKGLRKFIFAKNEIKYFTKVVKRPIARIVEIVESEETNVEEMFEV